MTQAAPIQKFTNRDYQTALADLLARIKERRTDVFSDFSESNLGMLLVELAAGVCDIVSYGQDAAATEVFLSTCQRYESALAFAKSVGYTPRPFTAATATMISSGEPPAAVISYGGTIRKGQTITGNNGLKYEVVSDVVVPAGMSVLRVNVVEGQSYRETFSPINTKNRIVTVSSAQVADGSWTIYVGDTSDPDNAWTQVDSIFLETNPTHTYDVSFDAVGRLQVRFGDNAAGGIPDQTITVDYRVCNGLAGNTPAKGIKGTLQVELASPGVGTQSVEFENFEAQAQTVGGTQFQSGEQLGLTNGGPSLTFLLAHAPVVPGQVLVTIATSSGSVVLRDDNNGSFSVLSNTTGRTLNSSQIIYSSGSCALTFDGSITAGGSISADYSFFVAADPTQVVIVGAASGGDDRESLDELRVNVATFVRTQDRLITAEDYRKGLTRVAAVELAFADVWASSFNGNVVRLYIWSRENATLTAKTTAGTSISVPYTRYARAGDSTVLAVQDFLKPRTLLTVHHVVYRPEIAWVDLYLSTILYDKRMPIDTVRQGVASAIAAVFESFDGFSVLISEIYNAVRDVKGVLQFTLDRLTMGYRDQSSTPESQGSTSGTSSVSGTLTTVPISPGSVVITIQQSADVAITLTDDAAGGFVVSAGGVTLLTGAINYLTGAWSATFTASLVSNQVVSAVYNDVQFDYRRVQNSAWNDPSSPDMWPPPVLDFGTPYTDGNPLVWGGPGDPGGVHQYAPLKDLNLTPVSSSAHFYDETFLYNDEIFYDSVAVDSAFVRAINVRKVTFDLAAR